jgi:UDP-GlcNAc:undecaprenyl-phosphate GlcNAc-1-phosphate transferase
LSLIHNPVTTQLNIRWPFLQPLIPAVCVIFLLGLLDDIIGLKPYVKLAVQIGCSAWVFYHGIYVGAVSNPLGKGFDVGVWSLPLTVLWLVGITNAFNLVDGVDGLAAGIALFSMLILGIASLLTGNTVLVAIIVALGGATAGFLLFNFHPASIFLGDSGSLFLGFTLAALSLLWGEKSSLAVSMLGPVLVFALPVADTGLAIVRRFIDGAPIFTADRDHIHHRLLKLGLSPRRAVLVLYGVCFLFGLVGLAFTSIQTGVGIFVVMLAAICAWLLLSGLGYHELAEINLTLRRGLLDQRSTIRQRVQFRKAVQVVAGATTFDDLWSSLVQLAKAFDFDRVELCLNPETRAGLGLQADSDVDGGWLQRSWSEGGGLASVDQLPRFWTIKLPIGPDLTSRNYAAFSRTMDKEELHFRIEPFVQELATGIMKGVTRISEGRSHSIPLNGARASGSAQGGSRS